MPDSHRETFWIELTKDGWAVMPDGKITPVAICKTEEEARAVAQRLQHEYELEADRLNSLSSSQLVPRRYPFGGPAASGAGPSPPPPLKPVSRTSEAISSSRAAAAPPASFPSTKSAGDR